MSIATVPKHAADRTLPTTPADVAEAVRVAYDATRAVYPLGGGTAIDYGIAPTRPGDQLNLTGLNKIVDYTPRDMTILVEAGVRMSDLGAKLATEGQHLPIDVPRAIEATIGGVVATNWCGPRRLGHGTIRDYVIGIHAVDGRGVAFKGGGRVVKNVAGYDFCKLLTGSLGTLGVITQLALKVKPQAETSAAVIGECNDLDVVERALDQLANLAAPPVAIDLLVGEKWSQSAGNQIAVRIEGTQTEVTWLIEHVQTELQAGGVTNVRKLAAPDDAALWTHQIEFSDRGVGDHDDAPLVLKIAVPPSRVVNFVRQLLSVDRDCTIQAHAGSGIILARFAKFGHAELTSVLAGKLRPAAIQLGGSLVVVSSKLDGLTPHLIWGGRTDATALMERIKQKFDPRGVLNPCRYVY